MPRIRELKHQYMANDIGAWVKGQIMRKKLSQEYVADEMGITQQALSRKIRENSFKYIDLLLLFKALKVEDREIIKLMKVE